MKMVGILLAILMAQAVALAESGFYVLRASTPLVASASAGLRFGGDEGDLRGVVQGEAGLGGGKVLLGFDNTGEESVGFGLKAAYLRTWLATVGVDENQDFLGLEGEISFKRLVLNLGGYVNADNDDDDETLISAGIGFIF